ncbi:hypothetical protein SpCBS45565_g08386 [Spizellomyces sp. 'palustris']|nr:hypothetical protein SpCBS45565_g08386 [Spizellomyces sp. 'palustris']
MGKAAKERKRRRLLQQSQNGAAHLPSPPLLGTKRPLTDSGGELEDDEELIGDVIPVKDLATTIATLNTLEEMPELLRGKDFKGLRIVLRRLQNATSAANIGNGSTLTGRISDALQDGRYSDAMVALSEMRERGKTPPLGALQRWVRDCDAVGAEDGLNGKPEVLRVLDAILRTADPDMVPKGDSDKTLEVVQRHTAWEGRPKAAEGDVSIDIDDAWKPKFRVVCHEKGPERRTPNLHDFILYTSTPGTIEPVPVNFPSVTRMDVANVPGAFLLCDVLSRSQCQQILSAVESVGFTPDAPLAGSASEQASVLAHNMFWLADTALLDAIFARCQPHLPPKMGNAELRGVNARWRVYRYVPGAIYRPHIDGAWPGSGLDPATGEYVYDFYKDRRSRLTFLIYLNEDFEGGATTFFLPSGQVGIMDAFPVRPRTGCVLCFPHGDTKGSLLHEGSALTRGTKYIIRADVLYTIER